MHFSPFEQMYDGKIKNLTFFMAFYAMDFRTSGPSWTNPVTYGSGNNSEFGRNAFGTYVGPLSLNLGHLVRRRLKVL